MFSFLRRKAIEEENGVISNAEDEEKSVSKPCCHEPPEAENLQPSDAIFLEKGKHANSSNETLINIPPKPQNTNQSLPRHGLLHTINTTENFEEQKPSVLESGSSFSDFELYWELPRNISLNRGRFIAPNMDAQQTSVSKTCSLQPRGRRKKPKMKKKKKEAESFENSYEFFVEHFGRIIALEEKSCTQPADDGYSEEISSPMPFKNLRKSG